MSYSIGGTAVNGVDYASLTGSVTISANSFSSTITVTTLDDSLVEGNKTLVVTLTANPAYTVGSPGSATITIIDNDLSLPTVSVTGGTFTFDGNPHGATGFAYGVGGVSDVLDPPVTISYQGTGSTAYGPTSTPPTNVGSYVATASFAGNGNYSSASNSAALTINDTTAPDTSITSGPGGTITVNSATFNWSGSDDVTPPANLQYAYRLDPIEPNFSAFGTATTKTYAGLANSSYTFVVKAKDQAGNEDVSPATRAFTVSVPSGTTLSVSPTSATPGSAVTASWNGIAAPTPRDWIALYVPGAADGNFLSWMYVSCSQTPGAAAASGSCLYGLPNTSGTYELRLYSNDSLTRLATSSTFVITPITNNNITISSPPRSVSAAPNVATVSIARAECSTTFSIPYIQTNNNLTVSAATVSGSIPSGGGVKFVLNENLPNQTVQFSLAAPYSATFAGLAKGEYRLDAYLVDASQNVIAGNANHDFATNIGIGDIYVAIGDSITEGYNGIGFNVPPYASWLQAPMASNDNRNYPQCGIGSGFTRDHWQEASHHIALNNELESYLGYPVFILNEGVAGINTFGYIDRMATVSWQNRIAALQPNKWLFHLGNNDVGGSPAIQSNFQTMIDTLKNSYGAAGSGIVLAVPADGVNWQPYINNLISANGLLKGPDFNTFYLNNPSLTDGIHPNVAGHVQMARLWALSIMAPKNVTAQQFGTQVKVSWDDLKTIEPTVNGYKVFYGTNPANLTNVVDVGYTTTAFINSLSPGQTYYFVVRGYDNDPFVPNPTASSPPVGFLMGSN